MAALTFEAALSAFRELARSQNWEICGERQIQHGYQFRITDAARREEISVNFYTTGKALIQGNPGALKAAVETCWQQYLESNGIGTADVPRKASQPKAAIPSATGAARIGLDESGKGDFFGPLVVGAVFADASIELALLERGVRDSKRLTDDQIAALAAEIRALCPFAVVVLNPPRYNALYAELGNLNRLLAACHAQALEMLLETLEHQGRAGCELAIADQFGSESRLIEALGERGRQIKLEQRPRAEDDAAVAAASIVARAAFVAHLSALSQQVGVALPKGASDPAIISVGRAVAAKGGQAALAQVAKLHFKTTRAIIAD